MRQKGFTLIELVMVIVILGILASIALPTFFNLRENAREAACKGGLGGLRSAIAIWYAMQVASGVDVANAWPPIESLRSGGVMAHDRIPENPYVVDEPSRIEIGAGTISDAADTQYGWIYDASTGELWATSPDGDKSRW